MPMSSITIRSARIRRPIALATLSSARWRRSITASDSSVCQATVLPRSIARCSSASTRWLLPVPLGPQTHSASARPIDSSVFDHVGYGGSDVEQELLRARRREQDVALELQRGLLAGGLQGGKGIEIGVAYRPADTGIEVGGDWYDAFWLEPDETLGIVVGDVVGRGVRAAATMGQLRSALRALASTGLEPGALLEALSEFARRHEVGQMATVAYAEIDVRLGAMRYACAGHPPPAVLEPAAGARFTSDGRSPPLDAYEHWVDRPQATCRLAPAATIVLY